MIISKIPEIQEVSPRLVRFLGTNISNGMYGFDVVHLIT
jgi:hypothetical protein